MPPGCQGDTICIYVWPEPTGLSNFSTSNITIYPNPTRGVVTISFTSHINNDYLVRIVNLIGEIVFLESLDSYVGTYKKTINLSSYSKAIYFLEIETDYGIINKKLILH